MEKEKVRLSLYLNRELNEYLDDQAKKLGVSKSGYMSMLVVQDKMQKDVIAMNSGVQTVLDRISDLEKKIK